MGDKTNGKLVSFDSRPMRDLGGSFGVTFDKDGLKEAGFLTEDGDLERPIKVQIAQYDDGSVDVEIDG
jgi:hypothetical protein